MVDFLTPYAVNDSVIPAEGLRRFYQDQTQGAAGVSRPGDLKISALNVPGTGVRVAAGNSVIPCRAPSRDRESYGIPLLAEGVYMGESGTGIPGTGSSGGRRDMIIHEITDPSLPVTFTPRAEIPAGVLSKISVVPGVPAGAREVKDVPALNNVTAYALAAINWPASTGTITNAMIEDLRQVAQPRREIHTRNYEMVAGESSAITATTPYPQGATWPSHAEVDDAWARLLIPEWATQMRIVMTWNGVVIPGGAANGWVWVQVGTNTNPDRVLTQGRRWNTSRDGWRATGTVAIPESLRGTVQGFFPRATRLAGSNATAPVLDSASGLDLLVEFLQVAG